MKKINNIPECINCGLTKSTCEMENGDKWVKNCQGIEGKKHEFNVTEKTMTKPFIEESISRLRSFWGEAPEGTLKHGKLKDLESFLSQELHSFAKRIGERVEGVENRGNNGEGLPFENSPEIYGNQRVESFKKGFNKALSKVHSSPLL